MSAREYDPTTGYTTIVTTGGVVRAYGRHDVHPGRTTPRKRKDRHVVVGPTPATSVVERTSALASDGMLNMSREDRNMARRERHEQARVRASSLDPVEAIGLLALRADLPPA